ncbi:MAG: erythromycin esterase family protein [Gemmatimonadota bacterium]
MRRWRWLTILAAATLAACQEQAQNSPTSPTGPTPPTPSAVATWLKANALPLSTVDIHAPLDDLAGLRDLVGDAHIVSLGEATHGTRDFFQIKARFLRYLVEEMGFNAFAIEATWPEANRLDHYVRTGEGNAEELLSGLYFWTWRTEAVLEMIEWMREYNAAGGDVGFYGFDMQFPGMALFNVQEFVDRVDPAASTAFSDHMACLQRFANGPDGLFPTQRYGSLSSTEATACRADLRWVRDTLAAAEPDYVGRSSQVEFDRALHSADVALQYESMVSGLNSRDAAMADNVLWLKDQLGPDGRMVLWAHNYHVSTVPGAMGLALRPRLGNDMVVFALSHGGGRFTAVTQRGTTFSGLTTHTLDPIFPQSYEEFLASAGLPRFVLDLRGRDLDAEETSWLRGPRRFRSVGCCYDPLSPINYWPVADLTADFDALIYFESTGPTRLLPNRPPSTFSVGP